MASLLCTYLPAHVMAASNEPQGAKTKPGKGRAEIVGRRSAAAKHYKSEDGTTTVEIYSAPTSFLNQQGAWVEIENQLVASNRTDFKWENKANRFVARFASKAKDSLARIDLGDHWVAWSVRGVRPADGVVNGNVITYPQVYDGVDLRYQSLSKGVKEEFIVKGPGAPLTYAFSLQTNLTATFANGGITLADSAGTAVLVMPAPFAFDTAGATAPLTLTEHGNGQYELGVAESWLNDPARAFPVVLDPSLVLAPDAISGLDTWIEGKAPAMNFGGDAALRVGNNGDSMYRSMVKFDLTAIPQGAKVTEASLALQRVAGHGTAGAQDYTLHEVLKHNWLESEASWANATSSLKWATPGGDFDTDVVLDGIKSVRSDAGAAGNGPVNWLVTSAVGRMASTRENYGFLVKSRLEDSTASRWIDFAASDSTDLSKVPKLTVTYVEDVTAPTISLTSGTILSGRATISANATDLESGVDRVEFLVDGGVVATLFGPPYQTIVDTTNYANGSHVLDVRAYDRAGNVGTLQKATILSDAFADATGVGSATNVQVSDGLVTLLSTAATASLGAPSASSEKAPETHPVELLNDNDTNTYWKSPGASSAGSTESIILDLTREDEVYSVEVTPKQQSDGLQARAELLDATGNPLNKANSAWTVLNAGGTVPREFDLSFNRQRTKKIRLSFTNLTPDPLTGLYHANVAKVQVRTQDSYEVQDVYDVYTSTGTSEIYISCARPVPATSCTQTWTYSEPQWGQESWSGTEYCGTSCPTKTEFSPNPKAEHTFTDADAYTDNGATRWWTAHLEKTFTLKKNKPGTSTHYTYPKLSFTPAGGSYQESNAVTNLTDADTRTHWLGTATTPTNNRTDTAWIEVPVGTATGVSAVYIDPLFEGLSASLKLTKNGQAAPIVGGGTLAPIVISNLRRGYYTFPTVTADKLRIEMTNLQGSAAPYFAGLSMVKVLYMTASTSGEILSTARAVPVGATSLLLEVQEQKPAGTQITYNLRFDGGAPVTATPGIGMTVPAGAKSVQVGGALTGTSSASPTLSRWTLTTTGSGTLTIFENGAAVAPPVENETVAIASPAMAAVVSAAVPVQVTTTSATTTKVEFFVDGVKLATDTTKPWAWTWDAATAPSGSHIIKAVAYNATGMSGGATVAVRVPAGSPTNLTAVPETATQAVRLTWQPTPNAASYKVYRSTTSTFTTPKIWPVTSATLTETDAKTVGATYYYRVTAISSTGVESRPSLTQAAVPKTPAVGVNRLGLERYYPYASVGAGSYVNLTNGNLVDTSTDLAVPGPGLMMTVRRTYNSLPDPLGGVQSRWRWNHEIRATVDSTSQAVTITNADGATYLFPYVGGTYQRPAGVYIWLSRVDGLLTATHKNGITWTFDTAGQLSRVRDRNANSIDYAYDSQGRLAQALNSVGMAIDYSYDAAGYLVKVAAGSAEDRREITYLYDTNTGGLSQVIDTSGGVWSYLYDADRRLVGSITPSGALWSTTYTPFGQLGSVVDPLTSTTSFVYAAGTTTLVDPRGYQAAFTINPTGQLSQRSAQVTPYDTTLKDTVAVTYQYDADLNLTSLTDPRGNILTATYDTRGNQIALTEPAPVAGGTPRTTTFTYGDSVNPDLITEVLSPLNILERMQYDASGNLLSRVRGAAEQPPASQEWYSYNENGALSSARDVRGGLTHFEYDWLGHLVRITDPLGFSTAFQYDWFGNRTRVTDPEENISEYTYDRSGRLIEEKAPDGTTKRTILNVDGLVIKTVDANGNATSYGYDRASRLTSTTDATGVMKFQYDATGNQIAQTNPNGWTTRSGFDEMNRLTYTQMSVTTPTAATYTTYQKYDLAGNVIKVKNANLHELTATYDNLGQRVAQTVDPTGINATSTVELDQRGRVVATVDALWHKLRYSYDELDRQIEVQENLLSGAQFAVETTPTEFEKVGAALTASSTKKLNGATSLRVVTSGTAVGEGARAKVPVKVSNGQVLTGTVSLTGAGTVVVRLWDRKNGTSVSSTPVTLSSTTWTQIPPLTLTVGTVETNDLVMEIATTVKAATTFYADGLEVNQVTRTAYSAAPTGVADAESTASVSVTNALGRTSLTTYDLLGRTVGQSDALGNTQSITYVPGQHRIDQRDAEARLTSSVYDNRGRVTAVQYPDGKSVTYTYDGNGNRLTMRDSLGLTSTTHDALGRPIRVVDPYGRETTYQYTGAVLTRLQSPAGTSTYAYNEAALPVSITTVDPQNQTQTAALRYDGLGRLVQQDVGSQRITWTFDTAERLTQVQGTRSTTQLYLNQYTYDKVGNRTRYTRDSNEIHDYTYDPLQRVIKATDGSSAYRQYEYDALGNRSRRQEYTGSTLKSDEFYSYDPASRLVRMETTKSGTTEISTYDYDRNGNQVMVTDPKGSMTFAYDAANRLVEQHFPDGSVVSHKYDGDGHRLFTRDKTRETYYLYDRGSVAADLDGTGAVIASYTRDGGRRPILTLQRSGSYVYQYDGLGSVIGLTTSTGTWDSRYGYDEFGIMTATKGTAWNNFTYTGASVLESSGLYQLGARYYNPAVGRFITQDTYRGSAWEPWTQHLYAYVGNNPVNYTDPTGHCPWCIVIGAAVGAIVNTASYIIQNQDDWTWKGVALNAATGAVAGALVFIPGMTVPALVFFGGAVNAVEEIGNQFLEGATYDTMDESKILVAFAFGAITSRLGGLPEADFLKSMNFLTTGSLKGIAKASKYSAGQLRAIMERQSAEALANLAKEFGMGSIEEAIEWAVNEGSQYAIKLLGEWWDATDFGWGQPQPTED